MIFFANVHKSIADEQENWRAPEGIFWSYINRLRDTLSSGCVLLCPLLRAAESLSWNKDKEEEESERWQAEWEKSEAWETRWGEEA